jgi:hypothetical protein
MSVEIEKPSEERRYMVFLVVNEYLSATLRGSHEEIEKAWNLNSRAFYSVASGSAPNATSISR